MSEWTREEGVTCVSCPDCAFTFDAAHTDRDGGYSCPVCADSSDERAVSQSGAGACLPAGGSGDQAPGMEARTPAPSYPYVFAWGNNEKRATLKGRRCRVLVVGRRLNSVGVEFEDGQREVVSRRALRGAT